MSNVDYINLLPKKLIVGNIFTRLPAKTLGRCKCVSKSWNSHISDPGFIKTHLTKAITKLIFISFMTEPDNLYSVCFYNNYDYAPFVNGFASKLKCSTSNIWSRLWGSCHGLILVEDDCKTMFILNPTTLETNKLPPLPSKFLLHHNRYVFGFGYDFSCDDYVVVGISYPYSLYKPSVYVYTIKTNQWKNIGFSPYSHNVEEVPVPGTFFRGSLHWLAKNVNDSSMLIAAYNLAHEEFSEVQVPNGFFDLGSKFLKLGVFEGCLCVITDVIDSKSELWVMKEYGVVESWRKLSVVINETYGNGSIHDVSLQMLEDSLVLLGCNQTVLLVSKVKESRLFRYFKLVGSQYDFQVGMAFVESLVSPNNKENNKKKKNRGRRSKTNESLE